MVGAIGTKKAGRARQGRAAWPLGAMRQGMIALAAVLVIVVGCGSLASPARAFADDESDAPVIEETKATSADLVCKTARAGASGWQSTPGGKVAGAKSGSAAVTALRISYAGDVSGSLKYRTYQASSGWSDYVKADKTSGSKKASNPVQALRVKLTGELSKRYNVYYRVNLVGYGWTGWGKNGQAVGARKLASVRGYQVKLVKKGKKAPGSAKNRYFSKGAASAEAFYAQGGKTRTQLTRALNKAKGANSGLKAFGGKYNFNSKAGKKLKAAIKNLGRYKLSFTMIDLKTGRGISYNPTKVLYIASSIKGPYVAAINKYRAGSVGAGTRATMSSTIKVSSNEGYSSLRRRFGHGIMKKMMNYCGISEKEMTSTRNYPYMSSRTLAKLWVGTYWSYYRETNTRSAWARGLYAHPWNSFIDRGLSTPTRSKPGWYPGGGYNVQNDGGVVLSSDGHYVVAVMSSACGQYGKLANLVRAIDGVHADMVK
ncbi:hypothetical protein [Adlercreutzia caecimuris]|uniref:hypothetical protein n=1 Tax=Adlercreutzia caecimuris TaxID=671266 RepID=UPI00214B7B9F|nr:hypothetical protein [Adlercreutzia caecimuris]MCR2037410.1 hypothetical protein [Adlercreutzia caecimuris]